MKKIIAVLIFWFAQYGFAQYNELGIFVGGANAITDIGKGAYIAPNKWALGVLYKRNLHERLSLRADIKYFNLHDNDSRSDIVARQQRDFSFTNEVTEMGLGVEYNFLEYNTHKPFVYLFTPYLHAGIHYVRMEDMYFPRLLQKGQAAQKTGAILSKWAIPLALGVKTRLGNTRLLLGAEVGVRYVFSNNIEGSKPENKAQWFGNLNSNDWYVISGITLTYTFGEKPCQCL